MYIVLVPLTDIVYIVTQKENRIIFFFDYLLFIHLLYIAGISAGHEKIDSSAAFSTRPICKKS